MLSSVELGSLYQIMYLRSDANIDIWAIRLAYEKMSRLRLCEMRVLKYYVENKHYLRHENKVNENKVLSSRLQYLVRCHGYEISWVITATWSREVSWLRDLVRYRGCEISRLCDLLRYHGYEKLLITTCLLTRIREFIHTQHHNHDMKLSYAQTFVLT